MRIAALTFVFNEFVNLPIWRKYYGSQLGERNLFIVDRDSTDGSTEKLGEANRILLPRTPFDDARKVACLSSFQSGLLSHYDAVICGDCDEIVVPNPNQYPGGIVEYAEKMEGEYATCLGIDVTHIIDAEAPIDLTKPIMRQRRFGLFKGAGCKTLLSRVPTLWAPGLHCTDKPPRFDPDLFNFHIKLMDYQCAMQRQMTNQATEWSERSLAANHGGHHRYSFDKFVKEAFLDSSNSVRTNKVQSFDFSNEIAKLASETKQVGGIYWMPQNVFRWIEFPEHFRGVF